jgi:hypothetical protein
VQAPAAKKSKGNVGSIEVAASPAAAAARAAAKAKRLAEKARLEEWVPDKNLHYGAPFTYTFEERGQVQPSPFRISSDLLQGSGSHAQEHASAPTSSGCPVLKRSRVAAQPYYWSSDLASSDGPKPLELQRLAAKFRLQVPFFCSLHLGSTGLSRRRPCAHKHIARACAPWPSVSAEGRRPASPQWSRLRASAEDQLVAESRQLTIGQVTTCTGILPPRRAHVGCAPPRPQPRSLEANC